MSQACQRVDRLRVQEKHLNPTYLLTAPHISSSSTLTGHIAKVGSISVMPMLIDAQPKQRSQAHLERTHALSTVSPAQYAIDFNVLLRKVHTSVR
jgi:hypothetical protein